MKSFYKIILIAFIILGTVNLHGSPSAAEQIPSSGTEEIVKKLSSLFPKIEGNVLSAEDNTVKINLGSKDGISPQMRLTIVREGNEFFHPVTKVIMGRFEDYLGILEIRDVKEDVSIGVILEQREGIKTGDKVRITSGRIKIASISKEVTDRDAIESFHEALEGTGRFRILEDEKVRAMIEKEGLQKIGLDSGEEIRRLAKALDVEVIIFLELKTTPGGPFLRADLFHSFDGKNIGTYEALIPPIRKMDIGLSLPERKDYWKTFDFNYRARLIGIGDLDGDGRREIVISDGTRIRIYRLEGSDLLEVWADKDRTGDNHITIDVADINKNGRAEIFVTNHIDSFKSFVIEYSDGEYKRIWDNVPLSFRVMNIPGKGERLIAMGSDGNIHEYSSDRSEYIMETPLKLPPKIDIYGFVFVNWSEKGDFLILSIDDDDYLSLYTYEGTMVWRSKERYGGYILFYEKPHWILENKLDKKWIKGRVVTKDYGDGRQKVFIVRNIPITYLFRELRGYREAELIGLGWNGSEIIDELKIGKLNGFIADFVIGDLLASGKENLFLIMNPTIMGGKSILLPGLKDVITGKSSLLIYNLTRR
ncbi:MAG: VCBS repeat-containing protein [Nitrospirota bacterium]